MKIIKISTAVILIALLLSGSALALNDYIGIAGTKIEPERYDEFYSVFTDLSINGSDAVCTVSARVGAASQSDKLVITAKYIKSGSGSIGTKSATIYRSGNSFYGSVSKTLTSSGTYHCNVTMKLYDGSTLLETVTEQTNSIPY